MEIALAEQALFVLPAKVTQDQAREKAWEQKLNVFGTLAKFLMRPKSEEIQVTLLELRYEPFWHASSRRRAWRGRATLGRSVRSFTEEMMAALEQALAAVGPGQ